jgi:HK97 gp10 family phage protein
VSGPVRFQIVNLGEFKRQLRRVSKATNGEVLVTALTAGLLLIQNAAGRKAPKRTGTLKRSIHIEALEKREDYAECAVGTDVVYAAIQEFGGVVHQENAWGKGIKQNITIPPHPYLRPAWDEKINKAIAEIKIVLSHAIEAASK